VGEKEMPTQSIHPPPDNWNARNLLTVLEVAEWARVHPKTVYRWIKDGRLEAIQFGPRTFRIPEDAIGKFLNKNGYNKSVADRKSNGR
jgi:excisionase family DNA binding protein